MEHPLISEADGRDGGIDVVVVKAKAEHGRTFGMRLEATHEENDETTILDPPRSLRSAEGRVRLLREPTNVL
jgi:hypothetical protein